jgi:membrane protease subunit HflK
VVQYRVADAVKYVLSADKREDILNRLCEASLARVLTRSGIDGVLRDGRAEVTAAMNAELDERLRSYGLGVRVLGVSLTDVQVPMEVQPDFAAAQAALSDKNRKRFEASSRAETMRIAAKGTARSIEEGAKSDAKRVVVLAKARAGSFLTLLGEFGRARHLTVQNLYLDAIRDLTPKIRRKILLTPDEPIDLSIIGSDGRGGR